MQVGALCSDNTLLQSVPNYSTGDGWSDIVYFKADGLSGPNDQNGWTSFPVW